jgi:membrane peptidoglycan carboxypeptidase
VSDSTRGGPPGDPRWDGDEPYDGLFDDTAEPDEGPEAEDAPPPGRLGVRTPLRRRRRWIALAASTFVVVVAFATLGAVYAATRIPLPGEVVNPQTSVLTYSDGRTELARIFAENRTDVSLSRVPKHVQYAVLAAENRSFYRDPGFDWKGISRAVWNNVRGRDVQGGSTITQQYVKNAYLTKERTFSRKFKELVIAVKLDRQYTKAQILEWYLNTIYFGRGAYGIQAASEAYFGKPVDQLTVAEGAVLASSIRSPALYDPQTHMDRARARWEFVLDGMVKERWLSPADRVRQVYPKVLPRDAGRDNAQSGPRGYIVQQVREELVHLGIDESELNRAGLRVQTTIDRGAQDAAEAAVRQVFQGQPANLRQALVAVSPADGGVLAYYGGPTGNGFDYAQAWRAPGSSFKPYTLAAALERSVKGEPVGDEGIVTVYSRLDGTSPREFQGVEVHNSGDAQCPDCSILEAMKRSINTVFYDLAIQVGPSNVADLAHRMGIPARRTDNDQPTLQVDGVTDGSIGIGRYEVRPIDQATGFATFASGGVLHPTHFVQRVTDAHGNVLYDFDRDSPQRPRRVLDAAVANDVTYALEPVAEWSHDALADGRPSASKTGTQQLGETPDNQDAWMVGFTPQVSAAVWVGTDHNEPLRTADGRIIYGSGLPGQTWKAFMDAWLAGREQKAMPGEVEVRATDGPAGTSSPTATSAPPTGQATRTPPLTRTPTPTPTNPLPTLPEPSPTGGPPPPTIPLPGPTTGTTSSAPPPTPTLSPSGGGGGGPGTGADPGLDAWSDGGGGG